MRQFMQACLFAFPDVVSVVRTDLDPPLKGVSVAASLSTYHGHGVVVSRESSLEPLHLLDGRNVSSAMPMVYCAIAYDQYRVGQRADWQACCQLGVIRRVLKPRRL